MGKANAIKWGENEISTENDYLCPKCKEVVEVEHNTNTKKGVDLICRKHGKVDRVYVKLI